MRDPAVEESEALSLASFTGELPEDLHAARVHYLGKEGRGCWYCVKKEREEL